MAWAFDVEDEIVVPRFLDDLRTALKDGSFRPLPLRERKIPKPGGSGKVRKRGIPIWSGQAGAGSDPSRVWRRITSPNFRAVPTVSVQPGLSYRLVVLC